MLVSYALLSVLADSPIAQTPKYLRVAVAVHLKIAQRFVILDQDTQNIGFTCKLKQMLREIASILLNYPIGFAGIFCV